MAKNLFIFINKIDNISLKIISVTEFTVLSSSSFKIGLITKPSKVILRGFFPSRFFWKSISANSNAFKNASRSTLTKVLLTSSSVSPDLILINNYLLSRSA